MSIHFGVTGVNVGVGGVNFRVTECKRSKSPDGRIMPRFVALYLHHCWWVKICHIHRTDDITLKTQSHTECICKISSVLFLGWKCPWEILDSTLLIVNAQIIAPALINAPPLVLEDLHIYCFNSASWDSYCCPCFQIPSHRVHGPNTRPSPLSTQWDP